MSHPPKRLPRAAMALALAIGILLSSLGATVASAQTPAQKIARLRAQAAKVQATIERMNDQVEILVEQHNANQVALEETLERQRDTRRRLDDARADLGAAQRTLGDRMRAIYINGPVTGLEQLLKVEDLNDALTVTRFQESATDADVRAIERVTSSQDKLAEISSSLAEQQGEQEAIRARLEGQRKQIEDKLADQRRYLDRLSGEVKRAVEAERRRQEELRRQALARKLAAERAAREKAAREAAAREAAARKAREEAARPAPAPSSAAQQAIAYARAQLGDPYQWGAEGPDSFDCSGLTMMAYNAAGIGIPRTSAAQWTIGTHIGSMADLEPGDLVFYANDLSDASTIHHVGLYIGDGMMIEAPHTGAFVREASINRSGYFGATRPTG